MDSHIYATPLQALVGVSVGEHDSGDDRAVIGESRHQRNARRVDGAGGLGNALFAGCSTEMFLTESRDSSK